VGDAAAGRLTGADGDVLMVVVRPSFKALAGGRVGVRLPSWLRTLLVQQFGALSELLADPAGPDTAATTPQDPLAAITGIGADAPSAPDDPVLHRLRPDGYLPEVEDGAAAAEFRRFTEADLAGLQQQRLATVRETLESGDRFELDPEQAQAWLGALNDLRLALGTRLEVTDDQDAPPAAGDPRAGAFEIYGLLGTLQHLLLVALGAPSEY